MFVQHQHKWQSPSHMTQMIQRKKQGGWYWSSVSLVTICHETAVTETACWHLSSATNYVSHNLAFKKTECPPGKITEWLSVIYQLLVLKTITRDMHVFLSSCRLPPWLWICVVMTRNRATVLWAMWQYTLTGKKTTHTHTVHRCRSTVCIKIVLTVSVLRLRKLYI